MLHEMYNVHALADCSTISQYPTAYDKGKITQLKITLETIAFSSNDDDIASVLHLFQLLFLVPAYKYEVNHQNNN